MAEVAASEKWPKCVWVLDPGDKRNGTTIVRQQAPRAKFELFYYDNLHLFPKQIPTVPQLCAYYEEYPVEYVTLDAVARRNVAECSDRVMHQEYTTWLAHYETFEKWTRTTNTKRSAERAKLKARLDKLDPTDLKTYGQLQQQLKQLSTDTPPVVQPPPEWHSNADEVARACLTLYQNAVANTRSGKLRRNYYLLSQCFGQDDLQHFCEIHSADDGLGETHAHYAAPHHMGLKTNRLVPLMCVYGEFWEACYGVSTGIVVESQASVFGVYNVTTQQTVVTALACAPWRRSKIAGGEPLPLFIPVRVIRGERKGDVHVLRPEDQAQLRNLGYASTKYWKEARHPVYVNIKPIPLEVRAQLPRLFPDAPDELAKSLEKQKANGGKKPAKKAKAVVQVTINGDNNQAIAGAQSSRSRHVLRQLELAAMGEMTAADLRQQNKRNAVSTVADLLEDESVASKVLVGYKWRLRARHYWTEHQKRDPADAILTAIYALTCGSHEEEEAAAEKAETKARAKKREERKKRKRAAAGDEVEDGASPPPPKKKKALKKTIVATTVTTPPKPAVVDLEDNDDDNSSVESPKDKADIYKPSRHFAKLFHR